MLLLDGSSSLAALLLQLKTLLDNADGRLARVSGRMTRLGRFLDSSSISLVNVALFAALGVGDRRALARARGVRRAHARA